MTKKYKYLFYILLNILVLTVPINCGRVSTGRDTYTSQASRRQAGPGGPPPGGPGPAGPPGGGPDGPPPSGGRYDEPPGGPPDEPPDGPPPGGKPLKPPPAPGGPPDNPDKPKSQEGEEQTEDPDEANADKPLETGRVTDVPPEALDDALILDYGRYTTVSFHYEARQWMYSQPIDLCYDDYTKCYTSIIAPMPVCMMYSTRNIKTVYSYCDAYLYNCRIGYRYWRVVGYGKCIVAFFGFPALEDT